MPGRRGPWRHLAHQQTDVADPVQQLTVTSGIGPVQTAREDRDSLPTGRERAAMRGSFDPIGTAGDDDAFLIGHTRHQLAGDMLAVAGRGAGAGERDPIAQRPRQERSRPTRPQQVRGTVAQII